MRIFVALLFTAGCLVLNTLAQPAASSGKPITEIAAAAEKFVAALEEAQRGKLIFDFKDDAQRKRWSNLPTGMYKREGLRMGDLTKAQREAALAVLAAAFSREGYEKVMQIVEADEVLKNSG